MYSPGALDKLLDAIDVIQSASKGHQSDYWLSETGNVIGRYAERQFTDSYVAGFMYVIFCLVHYKFLTWDCIGGCTSWE